MRLAKPRDTLGREAIGVSHGQLLRQHERRPPASTPGMRVFIGHLLRVWEGASEGLAAGPRALITLDHFATCALFSAHGPITGLMSKRRVLIRPHQRHPQRYRGRSQDPDLEPDYGMGR
jgi:hypothetical protein